MSACETSVHLWNNVLERVEMEDSGNLFSWDGTSYAKHKRRGLKPEIDSLANHVDVLTPLIT